MSERRLMRGFVTAMLLLGCLAAGAEAETLYGVTGASGVDSVLHLVDPDTGETTLVGPTGFRHVTGIDFDPVTDRLFGVVSDRSAAGATLLIEIDPHTGAGTAIGPTDHVIPDITVGDDGVIRGWTEETDDPIVIDAATGAVTVTPSPLVTAATGVAVRDASSLYVKPGAALYAVETASGAVTFLASFEYVDNLLENRSDGTLLTGRRSATGTQFFGIDPATLTPTTLGSSPVAFSAVAAPPDADGDGVRDFADNCPAVANAGQENADGDARGDACDDCRCVASASHEDSDGDGAGDACDLLDAPVGTCLGAAGLAPPDQVTCLPVVGQICF